MPKQEKLKKKLVHALKSNGDVSFEEDGNPSKRKRDVVCTKLKFILYLHLTHKLLYM